MPRLADEVRQKLENRILMRRLAQPQEIASAVAYLVSDEAAVYDWGCNEHDGWSRPVCVLNGQAHHKVTRELAAALDF